jgi:hypothetical protein
MSASLATKPTPWLDWSLNNVLSAGQLFFTVLGFSLAIWQLYRAADANIALKEALENTRSNLLGKDLLVDLLALLTLEINLDDALKAKDRASLTKVFGEYSRMAGRIAGLLDIEPNINDEELTTMLNRTSKTTSDAKNELSEDNDKELFDIARQARNEIGEVSIKVSGVIARLQKRVGEK